MIHILASLYSMLSVSNSINQFGTQIISFLESQMLFNENKPKRSGAYSYRIIRWCAVLNTFIENQYGVPVMSANCQYPTFFPRHQKALVEMVHTKYSEQMTQKCPYLPHTLPVSNSLNGSLTKYRSTNGTWLQVTCIFWACCICTFIILL